MAHQRHLKELLLEDQEPFQLKDYIADKQCMLKKQAPRTQLQLKKPKPMSKHTSIFCKNACFFSLQDSPDLRKSPLFDFSASPVSKKSPNRVFLNVPAKTASLLLEAAMRIQKQSKPKHQVKSSGFGLFGSVLKRLSLRNKTHKLKNTEVANTQAEESRGNAKNVRNVNILVSNVDEEKITTSVSSASCSSCSSCNGRSSSIDLESSSSGRSFEDEDENDDDEGFEFTNVLRENNADYAALCLSPLSPFRFTIHKSPSPPHKSPARHKFEDNVNYENESSMKYQVEEDEEDKEQNSPVSVLDAPFDDDYDGHEEDGYDEECSYAFVQRAKQQLLHKLNRFEKLAELDPIELEKRMIEEDDKCDEDRMLEQGDECDTYAYESFTFAEHEQGRELFEDVISTSGYKDIKKPGIKRLISDLIIEEESVENALDTDEQVMKRVCKKLESWREVECNTIDMMVEMDLRQDIGGWKKPQSEISETATDIEVAIFAVLVKELVEDLACSA